MPTDTPSQGRRRCLVASFAACAAPLATARQRAAAAPAGFAPLLATVYAGQVDPAACLVSEKYDGVRALWDGERLRHRSGRLVAAPRSFTDALPPYGLDGELWFGRGRFDALSALVRRRVPDDAAWRSVRYMVFEMPGAGGTFAERAARIAAAAQPRAATPVRFEAVVQTPGRDARALERRLAEVVAGGGEGLVLHVASAAESAGRSGVLMKLKPHLDDEAIVVGHRAGSGKYAGEAGALLVEHSDGRRFLVGSGLSDADRREPPPIGSRITYRYRDLTPSGLPRFATYLRAAADDR